MFAGLFKLFPKMALTASTLRDYLLLKCAAGRGPLACRLYCPCGLIGINEMMLGLCFSHSMECLRTFLKATNIGAWSMPYIVSKVREFAIEFAETITQRPKWWRRNEDPNPDPRVRPDCSAMMDMILGEECQELVVFNANPARQTVKRPAQDDIDEPPSKVQRMDFEILSVVVETIPCPFAGLPGPDRVVIPPPPVSSAPWVDEMADLYE